MILSDRTLLWMLNAPHEHSDPIRIDPLPTRERRQIQPAGIDLRLGISFMKYKHDLNAHRRVLEADAFDAEKEMVRYERDSLEILPGEFVLGTTMERVYVPKNVLAKVDGRSSIGRMGLLIHITAGLIDPGFEGEITLEFYNVSRHPIVIPAGTRICQVSFQLMDFPAVMPYGHPDLKSKYQNQAGVTASRVQKDGE
jgi:dCTP deaminase